MNAGWNIASLAASSAESQRVIVRAKWEPSARLKVGDVCFIYWI